MAKIPSKIGKYEIESLIAEGGMGAVYKGTHPTLNTPVIIKKLTLKDDDQIIQRFNREARLMMNFNNLNIVQVFDHFKVGDSYYIVQEFIDGINLDALIKQNGYLNNEMALYITSEISKALYYAHSKGVVHRDIKPANILISRDGEVKLVDFGIASMEDDDIDNDITTVGVTLGTPSYMAPEQFENSKSVDKRADIYSLGVVLYEMVTGIKPFESGLTPQGLAKIQRGKYVKPNKINSNVSRKIINLIKKLMHHKLKSRYQDLGKLLNYFNSRYTLTSSKREKEILASMVNGEIIENVKSKKRIILLLPVLIIAVLGILLKIAYDKGYYYEYIQSGNFGAIEINLEVAKDYYKEVDEIFIKSKLFSENGPELKLIENSNYHFKIDDEESNTVHKYSSDRIYLPVGNYRLKLMVDGNLFWRNFYVLSRKEQKKITDETQSKKIIFIHKEPDPLPLKPSFKIVDQLTKEDITGKTTIYIRRKDKFELFNSSDKTLKTGEVQYFQFSKKGYYTKDYILKISPDQTDLKIDVELFPKPGNLIINTNIEGLKLLINGKNEYITGDRSFTTLKLEKIKEAETTLILSPGKYKLNIIYKGNNLEKDILIESSRDNNLSVEYNKERKSLQLK